MKQVVAGGLLSLIAVWSSPGQSAPRAEFEVASVKPNLSGERRIMFRPMLGGRFVAENATVRILIQLAYGVQPFQISGGPAWLDTDHYDIEAKAPSNINFDLMPPYLESLLEDRFQLKIHRETKELPIYALVVAKGGSKLQEAKAGNCFVPDPAKPAPLPEPGKVLPTPCGGFFVTQNTMNGASIKLATVGQNLSNRLGRPVVDKTGLTGTYDIHLEWTPDPGLGGGPGPGGPPVPESSDSSGPSIFTAIQEQLGLRLDSQKGPVETIVIDHVEKASEN